MRQRWIGLVATAILVGGSLSSLAEQVRRYCPSTGASILTDSNSNEDPCTSGGSGGGSGGGGFAKDINKGIDNTLDYFFDHDAWKRRNTAPDPQVAQFYELARAAQVAQQAGNIQEATRLVRQALAIREDANLRKWLTESEAADEHERLIAAARTADQASKTREAMMLYRKALAIRDDPILRKWVTKREKMSAATEAQFAGKVRQAVKLWKEVQAIEDNDNLRALVRNLEESITQQVADAQRADARGDTREAIKLFRDVIQKWDEPKYRNELAKLEAKLKAEEKQLAANKVADSRHFVFAGNGEIGGTGWITGYNVPPGSSAELKNQAAKMLREQAILAGHPYNEAVDFRKYDFVLGIAASTNEYIDLWKRVRLDEYRSGQATPNMQNAYNSLKGREFKELACHSNGAMICLAALENDDIRAEHVVLYGPQLTPESVRMWNEMVKAKRHGVESIQIVVNQGDPVPAASMLISSLNRATIYSRLPLFDVAELRKVVAELGPKIEVKTFSCAEGFPTLSCHDLRLYKINSGGCYGSSGTVVPGTTLPGRKGVIEPPPPC